MPAQINFATLTHNNQIKFIQFLGKHEAVLPSQKDDCHSILSDFGSNQFSNHKKDEWEKFVIKTPDSISSKAVKPFHSQYLNPIEENTKAFLQQPVFFNDNDISDNDDSFE